MMLLFNYYPRNTTLEFPEPDIFQGRIYAVSYTHLTLPTN